MLGNTADIDSGVGTTDTAGGGAKGGGFNVSIRNVEIEIGSKNKKDDKEGLENEIELHTKENEEQSKEKGTVVCVFFLQSFFVSIEFFCHF